MSELQIAESAAEPVVRPVDPGVRAAQLERSLTEVYAQMRWTLYGSLLLALCVVVGMAEGYDVQAMSFAAPLLAKAWLLAPQAVGSLLSISLIGQVVGGFLLAPLGDQFGRRKAILLGLAIAGVATIAGAFVPDFGTMLVVRFVAGLGLGLALGNTVALAMELVPNSWRAMAVALVGVGYPLGAAAGGVTVGMLLPQYGVAAVFYVGGVSTFVVWLVCLAGLPESPVMLLRLSVDQSRLRSLFGRLGVAVDPPTRLISQVHDVANSKVAALFTPERRTTTLLLWILNFANLSLVFFFVMWLPSLFVGSGLDPREAIRATSLFSFSGIAGGLTLAALLQRAGPIATLGGCYLLTIAAVATFATISEPGARFYLTLFCCGFLIVGSQFCLSAVVNLFYPGPIRATGSGFALGAGRLGGVVAPFAGGLVLTHVGSPQQAFYVALVPAIVSLVALISLRRLRLVGLRSE